MSALLVCFVRLLLLFAAAPALAAAPATDALDAMNGKELASRLCSNCHLVGSGQQQQANADVPSFHEIANKHEQNSSDKEGAFRPRGLHS